MGGGWSASFEDRIGKTETMQALRDALASLEVGLGGDVQIRSITTSLVCAWRHIERDPAFEIAAADLMAAARELASPSPAPGPARLLRLLRDAQMRLHDRLLSARVQVQSDQRTISGAHSKSQTTDAVEKSPALDQNGAPSRPSLEDVGVPGCSVLRAVAGDEDEEVEIAALARALAPRMEGASPRTWCLTGRWRPRTSEAVRWGC